MGKGDPYVWVTLEKLSRERSTKDGVGGGGTLKSRRAFGYEVRNTRRRLDNSAIRDFLDNELFTGAVLEFLGSTQVGIINEGAAPTKDRSLSLLLRFSLSTSLLCLLVALFLCRSSSLLFSSLFAFLFFPPLISVRYLVVGVRYRTTAFVVGDPFGFGPRSAAIQSKLRKNDLIGQSRC